MKRTLALVALVLTCAAGAVAQDTPRPVSKAAASAAPINLNAATREQLESLPGIGARTAERILEYRQKNGSFRKVEDLMNIQGIGEKNFLKLRPLVTVAPARAERAAP